MFGDAPLAPAYSCETIRQLATLLQAGLTLQSLQLLAEQHPVKCPVAGAAGKHGRDLAQGCAFSDAALAQWPCGIFRPYIWR